MKLTIEGTPREIKNVLQAIGGSKEHENLIEGYKTAEYLFGPKTNQES
jgi:hypothetical protein